MKKFNSNPTTKVATLNTKAIVEKSLPAVSDNGTSTVTAQPLELLNDSYKKCTLEECIFFVI